MYRSTWPFSLPTIMSSFPFWFMSYSIGGGVFAYVYFEILRLCLRMTRVWFRMTEVGGIDIYFRLHCRRLGLLCHFHLYPPLWKYRLCRVVLNWLLEIYSLYIYLVLGIALLFLGLFPPSVVGIFVA